MSRRLLPVILTTVAAYLGIGVLSSDLAAQPSPRPLEIRLTKPLKWANGCLQVSINRVNRSANPLFLPTTGLFVASSATLAADVSAEPHGVRWFTVFGASDVVDLNAMPLAAGLTIHDYECIGSTFAVNNPKKKTRREVPVRGKLRIYANYFLSEQDWRTHKSQMEEMFRTPPDKWKEILKPEVTTITVPIPCRESDCEHDCNAPPIVLAGEGMIIPDTLSGAREWIKRGKAINDQLAKQLAPCISP